MGRYWRTVLSVVAGSLLLVSAAAGDEQQVDKLRERADAVMREVQQLHEQGKHDEAQRLERRKLRNCANRPSVSPAKGTGNLAPARRSSTVSAN